MARVKALLLEGDSSHSEVGAVPRVSAAIIIKETGIAAVKGLCDGLFVFKLISNAF